MEFRKRLLLCSAFLFLGTTAFSQQDLSQDRVQELQKLKEEVEGTYQIQMIDTRGRPSVPLEVFQKIEDRRKADRAVYIDVDPHMRIKVLPQQKIDSESFEGVKERVVYKASRKK